MLRQLGLALVILVFAVEVDAAYAQSNACRKLGAELTVLSNDSRYRQAKRFLDSVKTQKTQLKRTERRYVRDGCNKKAKAGIRLTGQCRVLADQVLSQRKNLGKLEKRAAGGQTVAARREKVLQQMARYNCRTRSKATKRTVKLKDDRPKNLLEMIFGKQSWTRTPLDDDFFGNDDYEPYYGNTVRSLCVRTCDGYYWPVSFSTSESYLGDDAAVCQQQCPSAEVELYYHKNPGEDSESMISMSGASYSSLPTAFQYRKRFDASCTCKKVDFGKISLEKSAQTNITHAVIAFAELSIPLPPSDPRYRSRVIEVAEVETVPLPRRRPGSEPEKVISATIAVNEANQRFFKIDGKIIRLVGPDTPYVPVGAEES